MQSSIALQDTQGFPFRQAINAALETLITQNAGPTEPSPTYAFQWWADTTTGILKQRNAANNDWIEYLYLTSGKPKALDDYLPKSIGQLAGMRNKVINGSFRVNQEEYVSGAATTAGSYVFDVWKISSAAGITFSKTENKTTVTIPLGQTLSQVIEGLNLQSGTYVLSWDGTAQGRIGNGEYGASGEVIATIVGGSNTKIEFGAGTLANVQLEQGTTSTPFEHCDYGTELLMCMRYLQVHKEPCLRGSSTSTMLNRIGMALPVQMRSSPTVSTKGTFNWFDGVGTGTFQQFSASYTSASSVEFEVATFTGTVLAGRATGTFKTTGNAVLTLDARL